MTTVRDSIEPIEPIEPLDAGRAAADANVEPETGRKPSALEAAVHWARPSGAAPVGADRGATNESLQRVFASQRIAFAADLAAAVDVAVPYATRIDRLARLDAMTDAIEAEMADAILADFGHRPAEVTWLSDTLVVRHAIGHARRRLRSWMKARRVPTPMSLQPATARVLPQPLGVVGIVAPWNYPYQLSIGPTVSAIAAGNRAMVKPSETTPRFAALLADAVARRFAPDELAVATGDADVARAFVSLPFDHLLFTGSTATGRRVALAAAANLTPVTLELGGKSPAIVNGDCDLADAAPRLVAGKLFNSGQTCIAPDYLLVPEALVDRVVAALRDATRAQYPSIAGNGDYATIVGTRHLERLQRIVDDARARGAAVVPLHDETETRDGRMPPFAIVGATDAMDAMRDEIFGPLLPIVPYRTLDDAIAYVNARDRPLALYWFGRSAADRDAVLARTIAGGVTINDCLFHVAHEGLPFGGVGASGYGRYHGEHGFRTFSHDKPVLFQSRWAGTGMMAPPYGRTFERLSKLLRRIG